MTTKRELKRFIRGLEAIKGRHTELVSVYVPQGYDIFKIIHHLGEEQGTAKNIKDAKTRGNVIDSLEKCIRHLKLFKKTPDNGIALFAGNVSAQEGKIDIKVFSIEPPEPVKVRIYRCDQTFLVDILKEQLDYTHVYGLIVMDRREASIGFLKGPNITRTVHLTSGVPGKIKAGGQCLLPDTQIQLASGDIIDILDTHNPHIVKSMEPENLSLVDSPITDKWHSKKPDVYKIITKYPRLEVESSKDHLFYVLDKKGAIVEKPAQELSQEDVLLMPEKINIAGKKISLSPKKYYNSFIITTQGRDLLKNKREQHGLLQRELAQKTGLTQTTISFYEIGKLNSSREPLMKICKVLHVDFEKFLKTYATPKHHQGVELALPHEITPLLAQFMGYYMGDGSFEEDRISFSEQDKQVALVYKKIFDSYFNLNAHYRFRPTKNYHQLRFISRPLARFVKEEFPQIKQTLDSRIPTLILQSKDSVVASFIKGYFDAEGYVHEHHSLGITSSNKAVISQLLILLLRFSVISSFYQVNVEGNPYSDNPQYELQISEKKSLKRFKKFIGLTSVKKMKKLDEVIQQKTSKSMVRQILTPGKHIRKIIEQAGYTMQNFPKVSNFFHNQRMMSKQTFKQSILNYVKDESLYKKLEHIYSCPLLPVKISKIEKTNRNTNMVDISVKNHNFIANGILVHNSARRYERIIDGMAVEFYKRINESCKKEFLTVKNLKGILLGGPGPTKEAFKEYLNGEIQRRILVMQDLTYTDEQGLQHLVDKSKDVLANEVVIEEKKILERFFTMLAKDDLKAVYGEDNVRKGLEYNAVDTLLISEEFDELKADELEDKALEGGSEVKFISVHTTEGQQFRDLAGVAVILRFPLS